uniref:Uncharacterized protein n=1 Tax=Sander lucioperca TaxID=283035 RepID=A0A8D0CTN0_SANLU
MCVFRQWLCVKALSQSVHWYGRSPLCVRMCTVRCSWREHAFPHTPYGASPVCVRMCALRSPLDMKPLPHTVQANGRSLQCMRRKWALSVNGRSRSVCVSWCDLSALASLKRFPQTSQP